MIAGTSVRPRERLGTVRIIARLNTGGPAIHTVLLTQGLDAERFRSVLVTGTVALNEGDMRYYADEHGVVPRVIPRFGRRVGPIGMLATLWRLLSILREERPAIVHTHTATAGILGRAVAFAYNAVARLRGRRRAVIVHTFHGHVLHGYYSARVSTALRLLERLLARHTDRIIAVSEAVKHDLVVRHRVCEAERVTVVPLGLDFGWAAEVPRRAAEMRRAFGIEDDAVTVGIVARLTAIKNHELFLDALARLGEKALRVVVVGDGERRPLLEEAARALFPAVAPVIFTGWEREQGRIYAGLDIVCLTSHNEGTPVALIEAMAAGRPFVATDVGGVRDLVVGEPRRDARGFEVFRNGIVVRPDDPDAFAAAVAVLVGSPELRTEMGARGREVAITRYSKERLIGDVERIYDTLLGRHGEEAE
jgi:glycosyltransferase involved in cell wall biosynthesis